MYQEIQIVILCTVILPVLCYKAKHDHTSGVIPARYQIRNQPAPEIDTSVITSNKGLKKNLRHFPEVSFPTDVLDDQMSFYFDPSTTDPKKFVNNNSAKKITKDDYNFSKPKTLAESLKVLKDKIPPLSQYKYDAEYKKKDSFFEKYLTKKLEDYKNKQKNRNDIAKQELASIKPYDNLFNKGSVFANMYKSKHKFDSELFTNLQKMSTGDCNKLVIMIEDSINIIEEIVNIAIVQAYTVGPDAAQISQQDVIEIINFLNNLQTILEIVDDFQNIHYDIIMNKAQHVDQSDQTNVNKEKDESENVISMKPNLNTKLNNSGKQNGTKSDSKENLKEKKVILKSNEKLSSFKEKDNVSLISSVETEVNKNTTVE